MPLINRQCDNCSKKDMPVYERYVVQSGNSMKFKRHELTNQLIPADLTYWCMACSKKKSEENK